MIEEDGRWPANMEWCCWQTTLKIPPHVHNIYLQIQYPICQKHQHMHRFLNPGKNSWDFLLYHACQIFVYKIQNIGSTHKLMFHMITSLILWWREDIHLPSGWYLKHSYKWKTCLVRLSRCRNWVAAAMAQNQACPLIKKSQIVL